MTNLHNNHVRQELKFSSHFTEPVMWGKLHTDMWNRLGVQVRLGLAVN
jgi:hypothetical protein